MTESKNSSKRLRSSFLSSIVSISLVLFMLGLLGMLVLDAKKISDYVKEHVQLNVFLNENVSEPEISAFQSLLAKNPSIKSVRFISKQEALDSLKKDLGEDATSMLEVNPLPASFELKLVAAHTSAERLKSISEEIQQNKMVREVTYQRTEIDRMNENFRMVAIGILVFCALLLFIAVALINSTIRISMYSRRFLIKSMQLVGATKSFIRRPFIYRAIAHGFYSGLFACLFLSGLLYLVRTRLPEFVQLQDVKENAILFAGVLVFGVLLSVASTFFAVNRYLRVRIDELYG